MAKLFYTLFMLSLIAGVIICIESSLVYGLATIICSHSFIWAEFLAI